MTNEIVHLGLVEDEEIMIDAAALEIAALDHPDVDLDPYLEILDELTERVGARAKQAKTAAVQADWLARILYEEEGFEGDRESYDDPMNADLIAVIDRRRGLPVSLSILYVAVARRLGWHADALNTPGHVLVRVGPVHAPLLIDPFNLGAIVGADRLASLVSGMLGPGVALGPEHLVPMSNRAVLVRLLMNQATRAEQVGAPTRALELFERITTIAPSHGHGWWERARMELVLGQVEAARGSLSAMLEITRDPRTRIDVSAALDALARSAR